ncbi:MAG: histidine phosphatase family protein [candidate division SR1 bacterium]|nr:histidine phosphatase family protein [candidate division SR1 bacterium]
MTNIYIVRHGQNEDNANGILNGHRDLPLTQLGIDQAKEVAQSIKESNIHIDKAYSSPLQRAYITGKIITDNLGIDAPEKMDILIERDFGIMTGKPMKDIEILCSPNIIKADIVTYFLSPEGAEIFPQLIERAKKALAYIEKKHNNENILIATHGDFGKMLYATYYNLDRKEVLVKFHFGNSEVLLLSPENTADQAHIFHTKQYNH